MGTHMAKADITTISRIFAGIGLVFSISALGADGGSGKFYLGVLSGVSLPSNSSSAFALGANLGTKLGGPLGAGAFIMSYGIGVDVVSGTDTGSVTSSSTFYGTEGTYSFSGGLQGFTGGIRLGLVKTSTAFSATSSGSTVSVSTSGSSFFVGPRLAYDKMMGQFSLGGDLSYLMGLSSDAPKSLNVLANLKFWL